MRRILLLLACLALTACFTAGKRGNDAASAIFDLGPAVDRQKTNESLARAIEVRIPAWLDSSAIVYRLGYAEPSRIREYARARWAGLPSQMIQLRLLQEIGGQQVGQGKAACVLRVEIDEFGQWFDTTQSSRAVLHGRVLWQGRGRQLLAELPVDIVVPANSPDSAGGVTALSAAVDRLSGRVSEHEARLVAMGKLADCRP